MKRGAFLGGVLAGVGVATLAIPLFALFAHSFLFWHGVRVSDESVGLMLSLMIAGIVLAITGFGVAWRAR